MLGALFGAFATAGLVTLPFYIASRTMEDNPKRKEAALQKAIERNHIVEATLVRIITKDPEDFNKNDFFRYDTCIYEYEWNGKKYKTRLASDDHFHKLTMYFVKDPRKAMVPSSMILEKPPINWKKIAIIVFILAFLGFK